MITVPSKQELSDYYQTYLKYINDGDDLLFLLKMQGNTTQSFLSSVPPAKEEYAYAEGKWMLKEVVGHLCDCERILTYRALRFSKGDQKPLSGFEENVYMDSSNFKSRSLKNIADEFDTIRKSSVSLFENFSQEMFNLTGMANETLVSVRALLFFMVVHERHHLEVIRERYL